MQIPFLVAGLVVNAGIREMDPWIPWKKGSSFSLSKVLFLKEPDQHQDSDPMPELMSFIASTSVWDYVIYPVARADVEPTWLINI